MAFSGGTPSPSTVRPRGTFTSVSKTYSPAGKKTTGMPSSAALSQATCTSSAARPSTVMRWARRSSPHHYRVGVVPVVHSTRAHYAGVRLVRRAAVRVVLGLPVGHAAGHPPHTWIWGLPRTDVLAPGRDGLPDVLVMKHVPVVDDAENDLVSAKQRVDCLETRYLPGVVTPDRGLGCSQPRGGCQSHSSRSRNT